jgi:hypothetical protein
VHINPVVPSTLANITAVRTPAPALPLVVAGVMIVTSPPFGDVPAEGFPMLVPPVELVTRGGAESSSVVWITESADICWPTP